MSAAFVISSQSRTSSCHVWAKTVIIKAWSNQNNQGVWIKMFHLTTSAWASSLNPPPPTPTLCQLGSEGWKQKLTSPPVKLLGSCYRPVVSPSSSSLLYVSWVSAGSLGYNGWSLEKVITAFVTSRLDAWSSIDVVVRNAAARLLMGTTLHHAGLPALLPVSFSIQIFSFSRF